MRCWSRPLIRLSFHVIDYRIRLYYQCDLLRICLSAMEIVSHDFICSNTKKKRVKRILLLFVIGRWSYIESNWIDKFKYLSDGIMRNTIYMLTAFRILFLHDFTLFALMLQNSMDFHHQSVPSKWNLATDVLNVI